MQHVYGRITAIMEKIKNKFALKQINKSIIIRNTQIKKMKINT